MEKEKNNKKKTTGANKTKSAGTKKVVNSTKQKSTSKNGDANLKKDKKVLPTEVKDSKKNVKASEAKKTTKEEKEVVLKEEPKKENKKIVNDSVEKIETEHGDKTGNKKEKLMIENNEVTNLTKIILVVTGIFLAFYLITYLVTKNSSSSKSSDSTKTTTASIQYDEILLSNLLKQDNSEYYVLAYDANDEYYDTYNTYLTTYKSDSDAIRVYTSIISNGFNKSYYDKKADSKTNVTSISDLKLNCSTLFKIKDGKIENVYEGHDAIVAFLKTLS